MKRSLRLLMSILFIVNVLPQLAHAQFALNESERKDPFKGISYVIEKNYKTDILKDSVALYAINFKIEIVKNKNGNTKVIQVSVNDSLAYQLFPSFKEFYSFDYNMIIGAMKKMNLVVPVLIAYTASKKYNTQDDGVALIAIQSAINAAYALTSVTPYNNIKEAGIGLEQRTYPYKKLSAASKFLNNTVILNPYFIEIVNVK